MPCFDKKGPASSCCYVLLCATAYSLAQMYTPHLVISNSSCEAQDQSMPATSYSKGYCTSVEPALDNLIRVTPQDSDRSE
jgi:hypothetical protein